MSRLFSRASRLGFGCASLGSRVGPKDGQEAIARALDGGINWFDVAPSYGDGRAEALLGSGIRGRRDQVHICTKCGIEPPKISPAHALLRPLARVVVGTLPDFRRVIAPARAAPRPIVVISGDAIRASLERSLKRLQTDYVDVLALHDAKSEDLARDDVQRALEDVVTSGKARAAGVASSIDVAAEALRRCDPIGHLQFAAVPGAVEGLRRMGASPDRMCIVTHSVGDWAPNADTCQPTSYTDALRRALAENLEGVVLVSMFKVAHAKANLETLRKVVEAHA